MSITRDPPAHQLGHGDLSWPSGNSVMRCTPPLCTSLPCIDLPLSSVVGHALASALPCLSCALLCSAAHALLHPRAHICHTLADSLCPRSNRAALHRRFPPSGSLPRAPPRVLAPPGPTPAPAEPLARAPTAPPAPSARVPPNTCPHRQLPCAIACTLAPPARRRAALPAVAAALFHPNVASAAHQPACDACCLRRGPTCTVCSHALCSSTNTV
jgi:hypothetical protein